MDETPTAILNADITGIRFGLASHKEIRTASVSDCAITHASQLSNPFLGLPLESGKCESCGAAEPGQCEGHFGYIELPIPIYHSCHVPVLKQLLSLICLKCLKIKNRKLNTTSGVSDRLLSSCCEDASQIIIKEMKTADGACYLQLKVPSKGVLREGVWNFLEKYGYRYSDGFSRTLLPVEALEILKKIPAVTKRKLSGKGYYPQDGYILKYLPVPPNCLSVPDVSDGVSVMSSDQSSNMLRKILKQIETIKNSRSGSPNFESHEVEANELQSAVEQYLEVRGTAKTSHERDSRYGISKESADSSTKAWLEKMRTLFIRKGSGFSSRSVITGDSYKGVSEIGLPFEIAQRITFEERVNEYNITYLQGLVDKKLCLTYRDGDSNYSLKEGSKGHTFLRHGQVVNRRIMDGDMVFINRPPTTHKHSLQALSVYVHDDHTVKINPLICGPLSADFDGDCVHLFFPQSLSAKAEVVELFSVDKQLPSSHTGGLNLQLMTDSLLSLKMLVKSLIFEKPQIQQLAMFVASSLPHPAMVKGPSMGGPLWTALQILQCVLPESFDSVGERHLIVRSEILKMDLNTDVLPSLVGELVASIFTEKGPKSVLEFFNQIQPMLMEYLFAEGFSVSLEDFSVPMALTQEIYRDIDDMSKLLMDIRTVDNELLEVQLENSLKILNVSVSKSLLNSSALGNLIDGRSDSANFKVVQQVGFLGPQLSHKGKFYTKTLVEEIDLFFEDQYPHDADYPTARYGLIKHCFFHGLDPYEELVHSVSSREVMVRSSRGLAEPGTLFKNLMAILRDVVICYDGTVRNVCSNSIVQFDYAVKSKSKNLFQAGEPVGVLAATAMSNPAYKAVLDSSPSSNSSWELMKEILLCKVNFKNDSNDRRAILYLNECACGKTNCQERSAYMVQNHLRKISLKDAAVEFMIEYLNNQTMTDFSHTDSGLIGHIHLNKELMNKFNVSMKEVLEKCQEAVNSFRKKKKVDQVFKYTSLSISECCPCEGKWSGMPCLTFCLNDASDCHLERTSQILADIICPVLLETIIKGDPRICSANIIWISPDTATWIRNPSKNWKGELALDVVLEKASVKRTGDAWRILLDSCLPVLHLIDTRRSVPYAIKQVQELLGISCAFEQAVQRLARSVTMVTKGVLKEHLVLLANSMTCSGNLIGFTVGGYKALTHSLNIQVPFTEATLYTPRRCFERAAEKCHMDSLSSVVASCSWGKSVAVGTGARFEILLNTDKMGMNQGQGGGTDVYSFLHMMSTTNGDHLQDTDCLGADVDYLSDGRDNAMSPVHDSESLKPTFDDNDRFKNLAVDSESGSAWDKVPVKAAGWGAPSQNDGSSKPNAWSGWGSDKTVALDTVSSKEELLLEQPSCWGKKAEEANISSSWGSKVSVTESESTGWEQPVEKTDHSEPWKRSSGQAWEITNEAVDKTASGSWVKKASEIKSTGPSWGNMNEAADKAASGSWGSKANEMQSSERPSVVKNQAQNQTSSGGWGKKATEIQSSEQCWGNTNEAVNKTASHSWGGKAVELQSSEQPWGIANEATTKPESDGCGEKAIETKSGWGQAIEIADKKESDENPGEQSWGKKVHETEEAAPDKSSWQAWGKKTESQSHSWEVASGDASSKTGGWSSWGRKSDETEEAERNQNGIVPWAKAKEMDHGSKWNHKQATESQSHGWEANRNSEAHWGTPVGSTTPSASDTSRAWGASGEQNEPDKGWASSQWNSPRHKATTESEEIQWGQRSKRNRPENMSGLRSRSFKPVETFTPEEQEILSVVDPMVQSIRKILHYSGYNEGDRLSADDEAYLLNEVFSHHPNKAEKMGAGVDHVLINKHGTFQRSRCFYVSRTDGIQEDFSTRKCLMNLVAEKFPDKAENFIRKYFPMRTNREMNSNSAAETPHPDTPQTAAETPQPFDENAQ
uniref:DNA-directed RNA polymerase subunit n=1 Tax=Kalanchoe fedtschenkoi TaxID=63787 RepID=A0A7N0RC08_KALFE